MEYKMKCNVCGKVFCYTDEDLKKNATNAGMGALSALGGLASALGGGTIFHTHHLQGQADRYTDKIVDYNQCPYCHSRDLSIFTGEIEKDAKTVKAININTSASTESLLKRVFIFLEDGEWETADAYCEACLDENPESAMAYLGKLMAELHVKVQEELKNQPKPFDGNANYRKAIRYADEELRNTLISYNKYINNRNENTRKDKILRDAKSKMTGTVVSNYEDAISLFASIPGWKDADEQRIICQNKIGELKAMEEAARLERERQAEIERQKVAEEAEAAKAHSKKMGKIAAIVVPILIFVIVAAILISNSVKKSNAYDFALSLMESGQYEDAIEQFSALGDYKDCVEQIKIAEQRIEQMEQAEREAALEAERNEKYNYAISLLNAGTPEKDAEAYAIFNELGDYKDSASYLADFRYLLLKSRFLIENGATTSYVYDSHGRVAEKWLSEHQVYKYNYSDDGTYSSDYYVSERLMYTYRYNIRGDMTHEISHHAGGERVYEWEYAEDGMSKTRTVINDGQVSQTRVFPLDEYGNSLVDESWFEYKYTYDDYGQILQSEKYWNDEFKEYTNYTYDEYGNVTSLERGDASGLLYKQEYELTYGYIYCPDAT